ncbi:hypothetical protein JCM19236_506 [Vibrio sp. JCM 19236]|nr:hypothetical protein JCM19236_506 [Vibrio sp. JCM 19236]
MAALARIRQSGSSGHQRTEGHLDDNARPYRIIKTIPKQAIY